MNLLAIENLQVLIASEGFETAARVWERWNECVEEMGEAGLDTRELSKALTELFEAVIEPNIAKSKMPF